MGELVAEIAPLVLSRTLRDIQALPPRDLLLAFEEHTTPGDSGIPEGEAAEMSGGAAPERARQHAPIILLRLSANPVAARIHIQHERVPGHDGPPGPFYRLLEETLKGATLVSLTQVRLDRLVMLEFRDTPSGARRALLAELTGKGANLLLLGPGDRLEAALARLPRPRKDGRGRLLRLGEIWTPPEGGAPPGQTQPLAEALPAPPASAPAPRSPISWIVECALGGHAVEDHRERQRASTRRRLERRLSRTTSRMGGLERRAEAARGADRVRQDADLLQANQHLLRRGLETIEVEDLYREVPTGPERRRIPLDPRLAPQENVQRLYQRHRKLRRDGSTVHEEQARLATLTRGLEDLLARLTDGDCDPQALDREAVEAGLLEPLQEADPRRRAAPAPRLPYRTFTSCAGSEIRVGRSARDNDALTLRHCRGNDLWLHTADAPGSHVVLRGARGREADGEEILDAAHLAVHFSPLAGARKADVHLAQRKHVHKPRGAKPGLVTLSGGKVLQVRMQPERLKRLLRGS